MELPKQVQDKLAQFQNLQGQLQMIAVQRQQLILQSADIDNAFSELEATGGKEKIYKAAGPLLIEADIEKTKKQLKDNKELMSTRIGVLEKQEKKLNERFNSVRGELESMLSSDKSRDV